jgi:alkylated DNA repair dioxygenase AlkB
LLKLKQWEYKDIKVFGKPCTMHRKTCAFTSRPSVHYRYSGIDHHGSEFPAQVIEIRDRVNEILRCEYDFNYCLLNYYKDGTENLGMHADDERDLLGPIASVSFGAERHFDIHHKINKETKLRIDLANGSLLLMAGDTQKNYKHGVPTQRNVILPLVNLTFRIVADKRV